MHRYRTAGLAAFFALSMMPALAAVQSERVQFQNGPKDDPPTLNGVLYRPAGAGPFPAIVALHGCSGLWSSKDATNVSPRDADWAEVLVRDGFVVLFPDSYGSRGLGPQCTNSDRDVSPSRERVADARAARAYLQTLPFVKPDAIALMGWSNGGSTVLYAVRPRDVPKDGKPDFRMAVAFYPGCRDPIKNGKWQTRMPLHILIGQSDNWTPAAPCQELASGAGSIVTLTTYPGAYHDFDNAEQKLHALHGLAFTADGSGNAMSGLNPAARADAFIRVPGFFALLKE